MPAHPARKPRQRVIDLPDHIAGFGDLRFERGLAEVGLDCRNQPRLALQQKAAQCLKLPAPPGDIAGMAAFEGPAQAGDRFEASIVPPAAMWLLSLDL